MYPLEVVRRKMQLQSMVMAGLRTYGPMGAGGAAGGAAAAGGRLAAAAASHHAPPSAAAVAAAVAGLLGPMGGAGVMPPALARVAAAVVAIVKADGPRGFYSGLLPNMLQVGGRKPGRSRSTPGLCVLSSFGIYLPPCEAHS